VIHISLYLDQATASISPCALLYNSNLFARAVRRSMMAGSSFNNDDKRLVCISILNSTTLVKFSQPRSNFTQAYGNKDGKGSISHLHFTQVSEEMVKQASFGLPYLTINDGLRD
jgi:hypothetical protein